MARCLVTGQAVLFCQGLRRQVCLNITVSPCDIQRNACRKHVMGHVLSSSRPFLGTARAYTDFTEPLGILKVIGFTLQDEPLLEFGTTHFRPQNDTDGSPGQHTTVSTQKACAMFEELLPQYAAEACEGSKVSRS